MECKECPWHHAGGFLTTNNEISEATKSRLRETYERVTTGATTIVLSEFIYYVFIMTTRF